MKKIIVFLGVLLLIGCGRVSSDKGDAIFREYLSNTIPQEIKYVEAKENKMMGTANLVFKIDRQEFVNLARAYKLVDKGTVMVQARDWLHKDVINGQGVFSYYHHEQSDGKKREFYLFWVEEKSQGYFMTMIY